MKLFAPPLLLFGFALTGCSDPQPGRLPVRSLAFSPEGKWLAAGCGNIAPVGSRPWEGSGQLRVWELPTGKPVLATHVGYTDPVAKVQFLEGDIVVNASNKYVQTRGNPRVGVALRYWSLEPMLRERAEIVLEFCDTPPRGVALSSDGRSAVFSEWGAVCVYELPSFRRRTKLTPTCLRKGPGKTPRNAAQQCFLVHDGRRIVARMFDTPTVQIFDLTTGNLVISDDPGGSPAELLDVSADGKTIVTVGKDGSLRVFDADLQLRKNLGSVASINPATALTLDGATLAVLADPVSVQVFDLERGECVKTLQSFPEGVNCLAWSAKGDSLAVGCGGHPREGGPSPGVVHIVELASGRTVTKLE